MVEREFRLFLKVIVVGFFLAKGGLDLGEVGGVSRGGGGYGKSLLEILFCRSTFFIPPTRGRAKMRVIGWRGFRWKGSG